MEQELNSNWEVLGEPVQTAMRACALTGAEGMDNPYERVKELMRGKKIDKQDVEGFISTLGFDEETARRLSRLSPSAYVGAAQQLVPLKQEPLRPSDRLSGD